MPEAQRVWRRAGKCSGEGGYLDAGAQDNRTEWFGAQDNRTEWFEATEQSTVAPGTVLTPGILLSVRSRTWYPSPHGDMRQNRRMSGPGELSCCSLLLGSIFTLWTPTPMPAWPCFLHMTPRPQPSTGSHSFSSTGSVPQNCSFHLLEHRGLKSGQSVVGCPRVESWG
jgi:hypothetical protein